MSECIEAVRIPAHASPHRKKTFVLLQSSDAVGSDTGGKVIF